MAVVVGKALAVAVVGVVAAVVGVVGAAVGVVGAVVVTPAAVEHKMGLGPMVSPDAGSITGKHNGFSKLLT